MAGVSVGNIFLNSGSADYTFPPPTSGYSASNSSYGISLNPSMGWFISDNTVVGGMLNIGFTHQKNHNEASGNTYLKNENNIFNFGIGGFARNYFSNNSNSLRPFGQLSIGAGTGSLKNEGFFYNGTSYKDTYEGKSSGSFYFNAGLLFGFTKLLNDHTGLDIAAGYSFSYNKNNTKTTTLRDNGNNGTIDETIISDPTQKFTGHGFAFTLGYQVFLNRRK